MKTRSYHRRLGRRAGPGRYDRRLSEEERRAEQRARLLDAAAEVFAARGLRGASVAAVVRRGRMSRRTFYEHFRDLDDVFLSVYDRAASTLYRSVREAVAPHRDPIDRLRAGIVAYLEGFRRHASLARVLYQEIRAAGREHAARHAATQARFVAFVLEEAAAAHERGDIARRPSELTAFALVAALEAVGLRYLERAEEDRLLEAVPDLVELVFRALR